MQTRVRTRLRRYYFSPLASVHVPQGAASAPPQVRLRLQVAAIAGRLTEGLCGRSGSSWTLLFRPSHHRTSAPIRRAVVPCLLSELPSPTCFRCRFYSTYLDKPASPRLAGVPPQAGPAASEPLPSHFNPASATVELPRPPGGFFHCEPVLLEFASVSTTCYYRRHPYNRCCHFAFAVLAASRPVGAL